MLSWQGPALSNTTPQVRGRVSTSTETQPQPPRPHKSTFDKPQQQTQTPKLLADIQLTKKPSVQQPYLAPNHTPSHQQSQWQATYPPSTPPQPPKSPPYGKTSSPAKKTAPPRTTHTSAAPCAPTTSTRGASSPPGCRLTPRHRRPLSWRRIMRRATLGRGMGLWVLVAGTGARI